MQTPAQIVFLGLDRSDAIEERIQTKLTKLEQFTKNITAARVVVEYHHKNPSQQNRRGKPFLITVTISLPGEDLVSRSALGDDPGQLKEHEDISVALRDAFTAMERQLKDLVEKRREEYRSATR
ncbi:ribosome-associated translation inhibitor RaiA [Phaeovibrio sulfidiphilus]|uniref:Ribosome-associated translation inhibitor RaiA n=1 Tax=Phaeovibrio sulfidiphilus TaxID=1220600 RepID=A0A8J6YLI7_9PROT|nr:HPF/RaiA family ribosome-associated protein [Phaeovibrio sulfidiphilus]MBE1236793.1 ribosome-associated translation inhibitor RaiA [Phaeovibrio sulfidiphilus]